MSEPVLLQVARAASGGGLERIVHAIGDGAVSRGWRSVVAYYRGAVPPGARCEYVRLPAGSARWPPALIRLARSIGPDVVHLHGPAPGSLGAIAARLARMPRVVFTDHLQNEWRPPRHRFARRVAARLPHVNVAVSHAVARSMARVAGVPGRVHVIPNGTPPAAPVALPGEGPPRLLNVANFNPWKGHHVLLDAVARLGDRFSLDLVGDGPGRGEIAERVRDANEDRVRLPGYLEDPWSIADGAWAYVHASSAEGWALVVAEAMMRGLPVISTAAGGIPEFVEDGRTGLVVPPDDPAALAEAIARVLRDRDLRDRLASAARAHAVAALGIDRMLDGYFDLYARMGVRGG